MSHDVLDNLEEIRRIDRSDMASLIAGLPGQLEKSADIFGMVRWPGWTAADFDHVAVLGMGGSAIGGDLVRVYLSDSLSIPMSVVRDYRLPRSVSARTLVIASSYSGYTEETLSAVGEAYARGCAIIALSSGGEVGRLAVEYGWPWVKFPGGFPPRTALGYGFSVLYLILAKIFDLPHPAQQLQDLAGFLAGRNAGLAPQTLRKDNYAKELAARIHGRIPVIYGASGLMGIAALRWKGQICENAENLAVAGEAPEFNHNEIVGWGLPDGSSNALIAIMLQSPDDHPRITRRFEIVRSLFKQKEIPAEIIAASGEDRLQHLFSVIQLADWVSYYLAILNGRDPTAVEAIDFLKRMIG
jgi:glucose/mannose-6-phosphate isomerase